MQLSSPETITQDDYARILDSGEAGPIKHGYPAVIIHPGHTITKLWAKKTGWLSSARWHPYSLRFIKNAARLASHGVTVPKIIAHKKIHNTHVHLVQYRGLEGTSIRELLEHNPREVDIPALAGYIFNLHEKGILFRAIHLGNVIQMPDKKYGLIDFTDVVFLNKPAPANRRAQNLATPLRYQEDAGRLKQAGLPELTESYLEIMRSHNQTVDVPAFMRIIKERTAGK